MKRPTDEWMLLVRSGLEHIKVPKSYFELRNEWAGLYKSMALLVAEMEVELQTMREKNLPQPVLNKKDQQIQLIVDFYNLTEACFKHYDEQLRDLSMSRTMHEMNDTKTTELLLKNIQYMAKHFKNLADGTKS